MIISVLSLGLAIAVPQGAAGLPDRGQLIRLLETGGGFDDVEFIYEGSARAIDRDDAGSDRDFQGTAAYRRDGSAHLGLYVEPADRSKPLNRQDFALFRNKLTEASRVADAPDDPKASGHRESPGIVASLDRPTSIFRIFLAPKLLELLREDNFAFSCLGWERRDGHDCLKVEVAYGNPADRPARGRYWIDLERGANPIHFESYEGDRLRMRTTDIALGSFPDGAAVRWIPVRGKHQSFVSGITSLSNSPVREEEYALVADTIRFDQKLPDRRFSIDYRPDEGAGGLRKMKAQFDSTPARPRRKRESPQQRLDRVLAEADAQSAQLEASSPSRASWLAQYGWSAAVTGAGLAVLGLAGVWWKRGR